MQISQINQLSDKTNIPVFIGTCEKIYPERKQSGPADTRSWSFQNALFSDATGKIKISFSGWPKMETVICENCTYQITGSGSALQVEEYNGKKSLTIKNSAQIIVAQDGQTQGQQPQAAPQYQQPSAQQAPHPTAGSAARTMGPTVGMALNNAVQILRDFKPAPDYWQSAQFCRDLYEIASHIITVSNVIESGKLAPAPKKQPVHPVHPVHRPEPAPAPVVYQPVPVQESVSDLMSQDDIPF